MKDEQLILLKGQFEKYAAECESAMRIAMAKIINAQKLIEQTGERSPFLDVKYRLKEFKSTCDKCDNRGYELTIETIKEKIRDIAGIRIITLFRDDIYAMVDILEHIPGMNIITKKDYIADPKPNGYMSLHLSAQIEIYLPKIGSKLVPVEIQVRDLAMELWATTEHGLGYKNDDPSPEVRPKFEIIAKLLSEFDETVIALRDFKNVDNVVRENTEAALTGLSIVPNKNPASS